MVESFFFPFDLVVVVSFVIRLVVSESGQLSVTLTDRHEFGIIRVRLPAGIVYLLSRLCS